jgi:tripartite-type tricarboxylate transporter receptor subunit TctC
VTGADYNAVSVKYDSPYKDLKSLVDAAKKQKITMSGSGIGTNGHMAMKLLEKAAGVKFEYVSYDGGTEAAVAVAGGHTMSGIANVISVRQLAVEKKVRLLAVVGEKRHPSAPDVPTAVEQGYKETAMGVCLGVFGPPKMPADIARKLEAALGKAINDPGFIAQADKLGSTVQSLGSADFRKLVERIYAQADSVKNEMKAAAK